MDNIIEARELQIERKHFYVELRENDRGKFLRITEEAHGRRNSIIVPSTGVDDFTATIAEAWFQNKNPADKRSFSAGEQHPDGERARHMANAKGKPLTTSTRSVMGMLTAQAA